MLWFLRIGGGCGRKDTRAVRRRPRAPRRPVRPPRRGGQTSRGGIVGHTYDDATVFRVGKALEHLRPWAYAPDHRPSVGRRPGA